MNEEQYNHLKGYLSGFEKTPDVNGFLIKLINEEIQTYEITNSDDFKQLENVLIDFGIDSAFRKKSRSNEVLSIKSAIFFNHIYNKYFGKLTIETLSKVLKVNRTNCYNYLKQYKNYERFYPITKELQNEFNLIIKKYEI